MTETVQARPSQEEIEEVLKEVIDPELGVNIVDLGLLYGMRWDDNGQLHVRYRTLLRNRWKQISIVSLLNGA